MSPPLLVLYGSLRRGEGSHRTLKLDRRLTFLMPCVVRGRLFDLGDYPAFVAGNGLVHAELFEPADATVMADLDDFEGFDPADPVRSLYVREPIALVGAPHGGFIYRYNAPLAGYPEIASGDWVAYRLARESGA